MVQRGARFSLLWTFAFFLSLFLLTFLLSKQYTGLAIYQDYGYGYGSFYGGGGGWSGFSFDVLSFYEEYAGFIDAFVFLLIFLGVGRAVFGEHFKGAGGKGVYVGLGIMLALGLLLWEAETGISIIKSFGPLALLALFFLIAFVVYAFMAKGLHPFTAVCFTYVLVFFIMNRIMSTGNFFGMNVSFLGNGSYPFTFYQEFYPLLTVFFILALAGGLLGLFFIKKGVSPRLSGGTP